MNRKSPYSGIRLAVGTLLLLAAFLAAVLSVLGFTGILELPLWASISFGVAVVLIAVLCVWFLRVAATVIEKTQEGGQIAEIITATTGRSYESLSRKERNRLHRVNHIRESLMDIFLSVLNIVLLIAGVVIIVIPLLNYFSLAFNNGYFNLNVIIFPVRPTFAAMKYVLFGEGAAEFWRAFGNSVIITFTVTIGSNLMMALAAYPLSKRDFPFRGSILIYFVITMLFSSGIIPIYLLMSMLKLTDSIFSIILISLSNVTNMLYYKTFFEGISPDIEEAATLDGANNLQLFFRIIVPMSLPIIGTCCFFSIVGCWNSYGAAMMFISSSAAGKKAQPLAYYLYLMLQDTLSDRSDPWMQANVKNVEAAAMLASIIPIILMYPYVVRYIRGGLQLGSVKG